MEYNTDLNEIVEEIGKKIIDFSSEKAPIIDFNIKTIKVIDEKWFEIEMKIAPVSTDNNSISLIREFLNELEDIEREHVSIEEIIKKYKKWLLIK